MPLSAWSFVHTSQGGTYGSLQSRTEKANPRTTISSYRFPSVDTWQSHNIDASRIRYDADVRRRLAIASRQAAETDPGDADSTAVEPEAARPTRSNETKLQEKKRKRGEEKAIAKIKASKHFQRRRAGRDPADMSDEDMAALTFYRNQVAPLPGQMENCELCETRFTVTAYSRAGPGGGLLCPKCSKELDKEKGTKKPKKKAAPRGGNRRQLASQLLDGVIRQGPKDLMTLCVESLAKNVDLAEDLGDLPPKLVTRLAAILSKRRLISSKTLELFLKASSDTITIYDGAKLSSEDFIKIFQMMPKLKHFQALNSIQFKNNVMEYLTGCPVNLETFNIHGANLIDDESWTSFLITKGTELRSLKVYHTDGHFGDAVLELLPITAPNLVRLKISHNQQVTDIGLEKIASLSLLQHLGLEIYKPTTTEPYIKILDSIGNGLRTFSLETVHTIDDRVLEAIHNNCTNLNKLRITDNEVLSDAAFTELFTNWANPSLRYIDFHKCRHLESTEPRANPNNIGLCSSGFEALMAHSGSQLHHLDVHACRHISRESFEAVFSTPNTYPELRNMDVSFCWGVNDFVVGLIFRACPQLKTLKVFGNFAVRHVRVPRGRILVGMPNALGMQIEGEGEDDD